MKWLKTIDNELISVASIRRVYIGLNVSDLEDDDFDFTIVIVTTWDYEYILETFGTESQAIDRLESLCRTLNE